MNIHHYLTCRYGQTFCIFLGLDPARPLIQQFSNDEFRLSPDDAFEVEVLHTNAGQLGEKNQIGKVDFCINGGQTQPGCKGHAIGNSKINHNKQFANL